MLIQIVINGILAVIHYDGGFISTQQMLEILRENL